MKNITVYRIEVKLFDFCILHQNQAEDVQPSASTNYLCEVASVQYILHFGSGQTVFILQNVGG